MYPRGGIKPFAKKAMEKREGGHLSSQHGRFNEMEEVKTNGKKV
jgi:hypothetical protein